MQKIVSLGMQMAGWLNSCLTATPPHCRCICGSQHVILTPLQSAIALHLLPNTLPQVLRELREALNAAKHERDGAKQELADARKQVGMDAFCSSMCKAHPLSMACPH